MATVILTRNYDGGIYITDSSQAIKPGDIVELSGDYSYINIENISGTPESPIIFRNKGVVTVGKVNPYIYGLRTYGKHFKFLIDDVGSDRGLIIGTEQKFVGTGWGLTGASNYEISGAEIVNMSVGFSANPKTGLVIPGAIFRRNRIRELVNPSLFPTGPEAFYLGNTGGETTCRFVDCLIEDNEIINVDGDGIQVCNGSFIIRNNSIKNFSRISRSDHMNAILIGGYSTADVMSNTIDTGHGIGLNILGNGQVNVIGNEFKNIDLLNLAEDLVYISGRQGGLKVLFEKNIFENNKGFRKAIGNYTENNPGSIFSSNIGVTRDQVTLRPNDIWNGLVIMTPPPIPKKLLYTLYDDGSYIKA